MLWAASRSGWLAELLPRLGVCSCLPDTPARVTAAQEAEKFPYMSGEPLGECEPDYTLRSSFP